MSSSTLVALFVSLHLCLFCWCADYALDRAHEAELAERHAHGWPRAWDFPSTYRLLQGWARVGFWVNFVVSLVAFALRLLQFVQE